MFQGWKLLHTQPPYLPKRQENWLPQEAIFASIDNSKKKLATLKSEKLMTATLIVVLLLDVMCLETDSFQLIRMQKAKSVSDESPQLSNENPLPPVITLNHSWAWTLNYFCGWGSSQRKGTKLNNEIHLNCLYIKLTNSLHLQIFNLELSWWSVPAIHVRDLSQQFSAIRLSNMFLYPSQWSVSVICLSHLPIHISELSQ